MSYPTSAKSFSTKATTDVVEAAHVNDVQTEIAAIEAALLTTGFAHNLIPSTTGTRSLGTSALKWADLHLSGDANVGDILTVNGFGAHKFSAGGTGANILAVDNTLDGTGNYAQNSVTAGTTTVLLRSYAQSFTTSGADIASSSAVYALGSGGLSLIASNGSGAIRFYSGGTTQRAEIDANTTASETPLKVSVAAGAPQRVSVGAADSGGAGFRVLRVAN